MKRYYRINSRYLGLLLLLLLAACNGRSGTDSQIAANPTEESVLQATATKPPPTAVPTAAPPTATPSAAPTSEPTHTPEPTPTTEPAATLEPTPAGNLEFEFVGQGKSLGIGESGTYDDFAIWAPDIILHDGLYHIFYTAFDNAQYNNSTIAYAFSEDGITWTRYDNNPIISGTEEYPKLQAPAVMVENGRWVMYLDAGPNGNPLNEFVLRATAPQPQGPWQLESTPVIDGKARTWDHRNQPVTLLKVGETYYLYYSGVGGPGPQMGLATSTDNLNWTLYDDPATTQTATAFSDPILAVGEPGSWDVGGVATYEVMYNDGLWEMFYVGFPVNPFATGAIPYAEPLQFGYATSEDGIVWERYEGNPVFSSGETCWPLNDSIKVGDSYRIYFDLNCGPGGLIWMEGTIQER